VEICGEGLKYFSTFTAQNQYHFLIMAVFFTGKYEAKMDAKGRVFIPSCYRKALSAENGEAISVQKDLKMDCLVFFPEEVWNKRLEKIIDQLDEWDNEDNNETLVNYMADVNRFDIDSQGRILLPKKIQESIFLEDNEVIFIGMANRFTLWSKAHFEKIKMPREKLSDNLNKRMKKSDNE
jgi:MraZ protein